MYTILIHYFTGKTMIYKHIVLLITVLLASCSNDSQTIKIGYIDPLSGAFANVGSHGLRELQYVVENINDSGGVLDGKKFEIIALDSKTNPQEALIALKQLTDQGVKFFFQGNSSAVAGALTEAVLKHNNRNPDSRIIFLNYGAVDPALTNEKCNFWHFRLDADVDMKMQALTNSIKDMTEVKNIYLLNQDYSFGHAVQSAAIEMISAKRPDIEIVGDELHPVGKIKDFSPYVAKIKASGADSVVTGNWGNDLSLLVKAGKEAGLDVNYFTYYAGIVGTTGTIGQAGIDKVKQVSMWHNNLEGEHNESLTLGYRERFPEANDDFFFLSLLHGMELLQSIINTTQSTDPFEIALALEKSSYEGPTGKVWMRKDNHQLLQPLFVSTMVDINDGSIRYDVERTGIGYLTDSATEADQTIIKTTCNMERPDS